MDPLCGQCTVDYCLMLPLAFDNSWWALQLKRLCCCSRVHYQELNPVLDLTWLRTYHSKLSYQVLPCKANLIKFKFENIWKVIIRSIRQRIIIFLVYDLRAHFWIRHGPPHQLGADPPLAMYNRHHQFQAHTCVCPMKKKYKPGGYTIIKRWRWIYQLKSIQG
jgi:hypothetical protein